VYDPVFAASASVGVLPYLSDMLDDYYLGGKMGDLDEAKIFLEKITYANNTKLGNTDYVALAVEILLKDYIQRRSEAQAELEKLTSSYGKST